MSLGLMLRRPGSDHGPGSFTLSTAGTVQVRTPPQVRRFTTAKAWGGGGAASGNGALTAGRGGGGGGSASTPNFATYPRELLDLICGDGGQPDGVTTNSSIGGNGGDSGIKRGGSWVLKAPGGHGGRGSALSSDGLGGQVADGIGTTVYAGGNGVANNTGGGGSAGDAGPGGNGTTSNGGAAGAGLNGTAGSNGASGGNPGNPVGGGAGGNNGGGSNGGRPGGRGELQIAW